MKKWTIATLFRSVGSSRVDAVSRRGPEPSIDLPTLRIRCEALLRDLELELPFDLNQFCDRLGFRLGVPIELVARSMPPQAPGCSIRLKDRLVIIYERETSLFHQQYIVFHEIGHALFRHSFASTLEVLPLHVSLDAEGIRGALARSGYTDEPEQEAEMFASLLAQRVRPTAIVDVRYSAADPRTRQLDAFLAGLI